MFWYGICNSQADEAEQRSKEIELDKFSFWKISSIKPLTNYFYVSYVINLFIVIGSFHIEP